jgi:uncharacterized protein
MKIALIGATGYTGSRILSEALSRGHEVSALVRDASKVTANPRLAARAIDVARTDELAALIADHDVVVSAFNPGKDASGLGAASIIRAAKIAKVLRLLVVGGAGSLEIAPGKRVVDQPDFPAQWKDGALKTAAFLNALKAELELNWTFLSPPANLVPGQRTGKYRVGADRLLADASGDSRISTEDLAVAMLDEIERPQHNRKRFTVAY